MDRRRSSLYEDTFDENHPKKILIFDLDHTLTSNCFEGRPDQHILVLNLLNFANSQGYKICVVTARPDNELTEITRPKSYNPNITDKLVDHIPLLGSNVPIDIILSIINKYDKFKKYLIKNKFPLKIKEHIVLEIVKALERNNSDNEIDKLNKWFYVNNLHDRKEAANKFKFTSLDGKIVNRSEIGKVDKYDDEEYAGYVKMYQIEQIKSNEEILTGAEIPWNNVFFFDDSKQNLDVFHTWYDKINRDMEDMNFLGGKRISTEINGKDGGCVFPLETSKQKLIEQELLP